MAYWYAALQTLDFVQGAIGVKFCFKYDFIVDLVCQLEKSISKGLAAHQLNGIFVGTVNLPVSASSKNIFPSRHHVFSEILDKPLL